MKSIISYIVVLVSILVMSWEQAYSQPLVWESQQLPEDAIRLRVLPNSDRPVDQWLKLLVRDAVTEQMQLWTSELDDSNAAEQKIRQQLPEIEALVNRTIQEQGFNYPVRVTFGDTDFPTIQYGNQVYPAGQYRAVLIEIGAADGKNWWCVLYPPLCLVDITTATVIDDNRVEADEMHSNNNVNQINSTNDSDKSNERNKNTDSEKQVEVKFFLAKIFNK